MFGTEDFVYKDTAPYEFTTVHTAKTNIDISDRYLFHDFSLLFRSIALMERTFQVHLNIN